MSNVFGPEMEYSVDGYEILVGAVADADPIGDLRGIFANMPAENAAKTAFTFYYAMDVLNRLLASGRVSESNLRLTIAESIAEVSAGQIVADLDDLLADDGESLEF